MELMLIGLVFFAIAAGGIVLLRKGINHQKDASRPNWPIASSALDSLLRQGAAQGVRIDLGLAADFLHTAERLTEAP
jgi:hypothetical protein